VRDTHGYYLVSARGKQVWTDEDFEGQFPAVEKLQWIPGGRGILATHGEWLYGEQGNGQVWFLSTDRPEARLLEDAVPGRTWGLQASARGAWVSFFAEEEASQGAPTGRRNLYVRELKPPWRAHDAQARACTWARNSHRLFVLTTHDPPELRVLNCDTSDWEGITVVQFSVARNANMGSLSPDGKLLPLMLSGYRSEKRRWSRLHSGLRTTRSRELWVLDTKRGAAQLLKEYPSIIRRVGVPQVPTDPQAGMAWVVGWTAERQLLLHEAGRRLVSLDVRNGGERRVYEAPSQGAPPLF